MTDLEIFSSSQRQSRERLVCSKRQFQRSIWSCPRDKENESMKRKKRCCAPLSSERRPRSHLESRVDTGPTTEKERNNGELAL